MSLDLPLVRGHVDPAVALRDSVAPAALVRAGEADAISQTTAAHTQTIASASESQSASSEEIAAASQALATLATDLQNTTQKFRF